MKILIILVLFRSLCVHCQLFTSGNMSANVENRETVISFLPIGLALQQELTPRLQLPISVPSTLPGFTMEGNLQENGWVTMAKIFGGPPVLLLIKVLALGAKVAILQAGLLIIVGFLVPVAAAIGAIVAHYVDPLKRQEDENAETNMMKSVMLRGLNDAEKRYAVKKKYK